MDIKLGIKGNFKDIGFWDTVENPDIPEEGFEFIPWEVYTYRVEYGDLKAKAIYIFTGDNLMAYFDYPGKQPNKGINLLYPEHQLPKVIKDYETCPELKKISKDFTKTIEYLKGNRIGPFEDLLLCTDDPIINPPIIRNNPTTIEVGLQSGITRYLVALQFCLKEEIKERTTNYLERFVDNRLWHYKNKKVNEYNESIRSN